MPARRRKARRATPEAGPVLWAAFALNVVAGMAFSPLTGVQRVRVVGVPERDQARVSSVLQELKGVPVLRVDGTGLRSKISADRAVLDCTFPPNLFGRAVVRVTVRRPVANVAGTSACVDEEGVLFPGQPVEGLPELRLPEGYGALKATLATTWETEAVARVCKDLSAQVPNVDWKVELGARGVISLEAGGTEVVLGSSEHLPRKIAKLKELIEERPDLLETIRQVNLTAPDAPMIVGR